MRFTAEALFLSKEDGIDSAGLKSMLDSELFQGDALLFQALSGCVACLLGYGAGVHSGHRAVPMMESLTQLERLFIELLRGLDEQRRQDLMRVLEVLRKSSE